LKLLDDFEVRAALLSSCWHVEERSAVLRWEDGCSGWQCCCESTAKEDWLEEANRFFCLTVRCTLCGQILIAGFK
jgi:hypothetical protein